MFNLLLGRSGSGKSCYLRDVAENYINKNKNVLVIVPEQFSFETGLYFLDRDSKALNENVKVLSFSSMIKYVFSITGGSTSDFLDEGTSKILMSLAIESCSDKLQLYEQQSKKSNFVNTMLDIVNEYKSGCVTSDDLLKIKNSVTNATLKQKLEETALIFDTYNAYVNENYIHNQDILSNMAMDILENRIFHNYNVFIDAFTGFTGQQYGVLNAIFSQAENIYLSLSTECKNKKVDETSIRFRVTIDTYHKIRSIAKQCNQEINEIYEPFSKNYRAKSDELVAIEENLYAFPQKFYDIPVKNVKLFSSSDIYKECEFVATEIKKLTEKENYRYKDIAIVCRDESMYRGILDITLDKFGIGYFMDKPENINSKPLVNFIRYAFESISRNFSCESILRMMKTGITKYNYDEISLIENYIFVWSPKWNNEFTQNINGFEGSEMDEEEIERLNRIEEIRKEVYLYLSEFKENTKDTNGLNISKAINKLINDFSVKEVIREKISKLKLQDNPELVDEYTRVWNSVVDVISKMSIILENVPILTKKYYELFSLAINSEQIANQPLCIDRVIIGTAGRARLGSPKVTFVIGAVNGIFPAVPNEKGIFTDAERELLLELGLSISCGLSDLSAQEQYSAYSTLSSPSEKLYVSYYTNTISGSGTLPSTIVTQIKNILPNLKTIHQNDLYDFDEGNLWCKQQAFEHTISKINSNDKNQYILEQYFYSQPKYKTLLNSIKSYCENKTKSIDRDTALMLYGNNMYMSASKIEDFYQCGYMYFCKDGLKLKERRKATIDNRYYGSLIHFVMEKFLKNENLEDIINNTEKYDISKLVDSLLKQYIKLDFENGVVPNKKTEYVLNRAKKNCVILVKRLITELKFSMFRPTDFELSIGFTNTAENDEDTHNKIHSYDVKTKDGKVSITGLVDRVDLYKNPTDGKSYIRIIDYKTGTKNLKRCNLEMGLDLQMFIYLSAIIKNGTLLYGKNIAPAGVCYMPASEFSINIPGSLTPNQVSSEITRDFNKHYCANGMFLKNPEILNAMDTSMSGKFIPIKINTTIDKKTGEEITKYPYSEDYLLDGDQYSGGFKKIFDLVDDRIKQMSDMLLDGYIDSIPTGKTADIEKLPCRYCNFSNACQFKEGMKVNLIPNKKKKEEN